MVYKRNVRVNTKSILTPKVQPLSPRFNSISHCVPDITVRRMLEAARRSEREDIKYNKMSRTRRRKQRSLHQVLARSDPRHSVLIVNYA